MTHQTSRPQGAGQREPRSARIPGFHKLKVEERLEATGAFANLTADDKKILKNSGVLSHELIDIFVENAITSFALPMGIATNFLINGEETLVPMAVEESSVIAAASHGAKLARLGGGFVTSSTESIMTGQMQFFVKSVTDLGRVLESHKEQVITRGNQCIHRLVARGGGVRDISWRFIPEIESLIVHVDIDTLDAMGANIVNTVCEHLAPFIASFIPGDTGLKILTNLCEKRLTRARCRIPQEAFKAEGVTPQEIVRRIERAYLFAKHDIYRATTHNKGVMNGIDPVVIATGNDWRAVEAGAHAYCCRQGRYQPLTIWKADEAGDLCGEIELPLALGTVGGVTKLHPSADVALKILGRPGARKLAQIVAAVGLAQNLSALRALALEGIQQGHMKLHQKNLDLLGTTRMETNC